jgi:hypothetical protein
MKISPTNDGATMINVFTVEPEKQQELIETWLKEGKQFELLPGFVSRRAGPLFGHFRAISQSDTPTSMRSST